MKTFTKFSLAAISATLLALGAASPAFAADINVGPSDVAGFENGKAGDAGFNYTQWHVGSETGSTFLSTDSLAFNACGVQVLGVPSNPDYASTTQVLMGFETRPASTTDVSELQALIDSISIDVAQGTVTLQVPMFRYPGGNMEGTPNFTTLRTTAGLETGVHGFTETPLTSSTSSAPWAGLTGLDAAGALAQFEADLTDGNLYQILGVGFTGSPDAVVNSITFGGNTYYFGTGNCAPAAPSVPTSVQTAAQ